MRRWREPCLMLITDRQRLRGRLLDEVASQAVEGGVSVVQLREKDLPGGDLYRLTIALHSVLRGRALLIVNERADVALSTGVDGVHLPEDSLPVATVRRLAGDACIIGKSVHSVEGARAAAADGVDYLQVGAVYETASKPGVAAAGVDLVRAVCAAVDLPVIAVGGITADRVADVVRAGADGVAIIGAIMDAADPCAAASALRGALDTAYEVATR
jgi:thiamine-phosphate pyrophosphorylase